MKKTEQKLKKTRMEGVNGEEAAKVDERDDDDADDADDDDDDDGDHYSEKMLSIRLTGRQRSERSTKLREKRRQRS